MKNCFKAKELYDYNWSLIGYIGQIMFYDSLKSEVEDILRNNFDFEYKLLINSESFCLPNHKDQITRKSCFFHFHEYKLQIILNIMIILEKIKYDWRLNLS